jgi:arsenite-transporting ATPase
VPPFALERDGDEWELSLDLRFAGREEIDLVRRNDELIVTVGTYRRALVLPDSLVARPVTKATVRGGRLVVTFAGRVSPHK